MKNAEFVVAVRTPGAPVVIVDQDHLELVIRDMLDLRGVAYAILDAEVGEDQDLLRLIPGMRSPGAVIIRHFDSLPLDVQDAFAQYMKLAADEGDMQMKVIALGTRLTPYTIVGYANDIVLRLRVLHPD